MKQVMKQAKTNPRAVAARIIAQVMVDGRSLSRALEAIPPAAMDDRALIQEMCYGTLREFHRLTLMVAKLLKKPLKEKDGDVQALLLLGLYQLMSMRVPGAQDVENPVPVILVPVTFVVVPLTGSPMLGHG